jgi:hypothetical protein
MRSLLLIAVSAALLALVGCTANPGVEYAPGSQPGPSSTASERGVILEAVDAAVAADLGQPVTLEVHRLSIRPPFAAVSATPRAESGATIDFSKIPKYAPAVEAGAFDPQLLALLKKSNSGWVLLEYEIGATDFPGLDWAKAHGAPADIFDK